MIKTFTARNTFRDASGRARFLSSRGFAVLLAAIGLVHFSQLGYAKNSCPALFDTGGTAATANLTISPAARTTARSAALPASVHSAIELVKNQEARLNQRFASDFDFEKRQADLERAALVNPALQRALEVLENEEVDVYIYSTARELVFKEGLLNAHSVGPKVIGDRRDFIEAAALQLPLQDFAKMDPKLKPKYGLIVPKGVVPFDPGYGLPYKIKLSHIRNRMTFSIAGDSRNRIQSDLQLPRNFDGDFNIQKQPNTMLPLPDWSYMFIPWKYRALLAGSIAEGLKSPQFKIPPFWRDPLFPGFTHSREYIEVQIHGEINPEMIEP